MDFDQLPQPGPGMCGSDREIFERVWRRVMPEDRPDCPVEVVPEREYAQRAGRVSTEAEVVSTAPAPASTPPAAMSTPGPLARGAVELAQEEVMCLGPASAVHGKELQAFIEHELEDWRTYQALARRTGGIHGRTLAGISADELRHAKRLHAAYFLISGVRYWPMGKAAPRMEGALLSTLRSRFLSEQQGESAYRTAAEGTGDACLRELYLELAEEENAHGGMVRGILEAI